jgi:hypothetical protein
MNNSPASSCVVIINGVPDKGEGVKLGEAVLDEVTDDDDDILPESDFTIVST